MEFRTKLQPQPFDKKLAYGDQIMLIGSCFSENIGRRLEQFKFEVNSNPFGILYNPVSIANGLQRLVVGEKLSEKDLFFHLERWHSFQFHSRFSGAEAESCLSTMNLQIEQGKKFLSQSGWLIVTLGTAWAYREKEGRQIVGNCHKLSAQQFEKELLSSVEIVQQFKTVLNQLKIMNPNLKVMFTVSPVRHLKDGFVENNRSKGILLNAVAELTDQNDHCFYFPSYELVMDDLRDYRFFEEDMVHPNQLAIEYIWERFKEVAITQQSVELMERVVKIVQASQHRPFNVNSEAHQKFVRKQLLLIEELENVHRLNFSEEKKSFNVQLIEENQ